MDDQFMFSLGSDSGNMSINNNNNAANSTSSPTIEVDDNELWVVNQMPPEQEKVLYILAMISATLSILGSSSIVYKVLRNRFKATPYDRIMLGLSGCDIVGSLAYGLSPILPPSDTSDRIWSIGNDITCSFLGFLTQFAFAAVLYNAMLSFYYLLTVRFNVKRQVFAKRYEIWIHVICLVFGFGTSSAGVAIGLYSELDVGYGCWVNDYPRGCDEIDIPCQGTMYGLIYGALPTIFAFLSLFVNNTIIYFYVRKTLGEKKTSKIKPKDSISTSSSNTTTRTATDNSQDVTSTLTSCTGTNTELTPVQSSPAYKDQIQEVATQGFLYVGTFLVAFTPAFVWRCYDAFRSDPYEIFDESQVFPLLVIMSITLPLQGFFNMLVYNRPNYLRVRRAYPDMSTLGVIGRACFSSDIPRLAEIVTLRNNNNLASSRRHNNSNRSNSKKRDINNHPLSKNATPTKTPIPQGSTHQGNSLGRSFCSSLDILHETSHDDDDDDSDHSGEDDEGESMTEEQSCSDNLDMTEEATPHPRDEEHTAGEIGCSSCPSARRLPETGISSITLDDEIEDKDSQAFQDEEFWLPIDQNRFQSSIKTGSSLEVISELSEMSFLETGDDSDSTYDLEAYAPVQRSIRWFGDSSRSIKNTSQRADLELSLRKPERVESGAEEVPLEDDTFDRMGAKYIRAYSNRSMDSPLRQPERCESVAESCSSEIAFDRMKAGSSDSSIDTPVRKPQRRLSPTPQEQG